MATPIHTFLKIATRSKPRVGMSNARIRTPWQHYPAVIAGLYKLPQYRSAIAINAFPQTFAQYRTQPRLVGVTVAAEFQWTASVLELYTKKLCVFVDLRDRYYNSFLYGDYTTATTTLEDIERELGQSLWLMSNKMQLLQSQHGLAAQKDYLEATIAPREMNTIAAWLAYYFSLRSEQNVSYSALVSELEAILSDRSPLADFILVELLPYDLTNIGDPSSNLQWVEIHPIVDRYEVFVAMTQLQLAKEGIRCAEFLKPALSRLESVSDQQLTATRDLLGLSSHRGAYILPRFDQYAEGKYDQSEQAGAVAVELVARSRAQLREDKQEFQSGSAIEQVASAMQEVLLLGPGYQSALLHLKKLSLTCTGAPIATEIASFVERAHDYVHSPELSDLDKLVALRGAPGNPWNLMGLAKVSGNDSAVTELLGEYPDSCSLQLIAALNQTPEVGHQFIRNSAAPEYRKSLYHGHLAFKHALYEESTKWYQDAVEASPKGFMASRAKSYLFHSILNSGDVRSAVGIASAHCVVNVHAFRIYPLIELITAALDLEDLRHSLELAVLIHLAARNVHPRWDRVLSDTYERCLIYKGVSRPHELLLEEPLPDPVLHYFLQNICVPRVMDDSFEFESVEDIENERILLCQKLSEIDPNRSEIYSSEIKSITREATIHRLLQQVESSKIYVDEEGIKASVRDTLEAAFLRYHILLKNPGLSYQAEKISRRIEKMLGESITPDLKNLRLPASEQESLFNAMLTEFVEQFALNPAYGLDTHLSTTIRHGAFEGHIRSPFGSRDLLVRRDKATQLPMLPQRWKQEFEYCSDLLKNAALETLAKFTEAIEGAISDFHAHYLRVKTDQDPKGLFAFVSKSDERSEILRTLNENTGYREFVAKLFLYAWGKTEESLSSIRKELQGRFVNELNAAIDRAVASTAQSKFVLELKPMTDALVMARTGLQGAVEDVCNWFHLPRDLAREPFELDLAIDVALRQIHNCYVKTSICPSLDLSTPRRIAGAHLDGIVEVLFILLQNIILRSGISDQPTGVKISSAETVDNGLQIVIENDLGDDVDPCECARSASEAVERYRRDTALKLARQEGGSGLSKIWRIFEYDIGQTHSANLEVVDGRRFRAQLQIAGVWE